MNIESLNNFLIVFLFGLISGLFHCYVLKRPMVGRLLSALLVGWLGAFIGYLIGSYLPVSFQWMRILTLLLSFLSAQLFLLLLSGLSSLKDY